MIGLSVCAEGVSAKKTGRKVIYTSVGQVTILPARHKSRDKTKHIMGADLGGLATCVKFGRHWFVAFGCGMTQCLMLPIVRK